MPAAIDRHPGPIIDVLPPEDASGLKEALPCPLCGYDLRGLPAGRCPECGHGFDPAALRAAHRSRHPYLFEHHVRRPIRSFLRTLIAGWLPKRFWMRLRPGMEVVPRRLKQYAIAVLVIALLSSCGGLASEVAARTQQNINRRRSIQAYFSSLAPARTPAEQQWITAQMTQLALVTPMPTQAAFWVDFPWFTSLRLGIPLAGLALLWPIITFGSLLVFRRTMRQARIDTRHVARVVVYSADVFAFVVPVLLLAAILAAFGWIEAAFIVWLVQYLVGLLLLMLPGVDLVLLCTALMLLLLASWRLWRAYRHYLAFPHAAATVLASQLIVWLALVALGGPILELIAGFLR